MVCEPKAVTVCVREEKREEVGGSFEFDVAAEATIATPCVVDCGRRRRRLERARRPSSVRQYQ